ncbi:MAG: aminotransferase class I/II-fold pyridoxal phosphate-dependent enzyme [Terriglobia bacterium]
MKAIILAAGYGRRMKPLTDATHKTLLSVGGQTIIGRICDGLIANNIFDVVVVTGYRADQLREYLQSRYPHLNLTFVHNARYRETNNIFSLAMAFEKITLDDDILLIESDLIYAAEIIQRAIESPKPNVALVDKYRSGMDGTVVTVVDGIVRNVIPPHLQTGSFDFSDKYKTLNVYKFSREFCQTVFKKLLTYYASAIDANCYYELILGILIYMQRETIHAEILDGERWSEVDDPNDLRVAEFAFNPEARLKLLEATAGGYWSHDITDFCYLRNMYFPNASMLSEMRSNLTMLLQNYGSRQEVLDQKMAFHLLCEPSRVTALNGASQAFPILRECFAGKRVLVPDPTFGEYPRVFPEAQKYRDDIGVSLEELHTRSDTTDVIVFVNPNNPSGTTVGTEDVYRFAAEHPGKTVLVDESFIDFSCHPSIVSLLEREPIRNVIVVKSLSKTLGVPGLRLGYFYSADEAFLRFVRTEIPIWNMNSMAEYLLEIILKHRDSLAESFAKTARDRAHLLARLEKVEGIARVFSSGGNFLTFELAGRAPSTTEVVRRLLVSESIYVKDVSAKFAGKPRLRVAVRLPEENARLVHAVSAALASNIKIPNSARMGTGETRFDDRRVEGGNL